MIIKAAHAQVDNYANDYDIVGFITSIRHTFLDFEEAEPVIRIETSSTVNNVAYRYPEETLRITEFPLRVVA